MMIETLLAFAFMCVVLIVIFVNHLDDQSDEVFVRIRKNYWSDDHE
jgi:hypothetical protein